MSSIELVESSVRQMEEEAAKSKRTLPTITADLERAERNIHTFARKTLAAYVESGRLLFLAKAKVGHGEWMPYVAGLGISQQTANKRMRVAAAFGLLPETSPEGDAWGFREAYEYIVRLGQPQLEDMDEDPRPADPSGEATQEGHDDTDDVVMGDESDEEEAAPRRRGRMTEATRIRQKATRFIADAKHAVLTDHTVVTVLTELHAQLGELLDELVEDAEAESDEAEAEARSIIEYVRPEDQPPARASLTRKRDGTVLRGNAVVGRVYREDGSWFAELESGAVLFVADMRAGLDLIAARTQ